LGRCDLFDDVTGQNRSKISQPLESQKEAHAKKDSKLVTQILTVIFEKHGVCELWVLDRFFRSFRATRILLQIPRVPRNLPPGRVSYTFGVPKTPRLQRVIAQRPHLAGRHRFSKIK